LRFAKSFSITPPAMSAGAEDVAGSATRMMQNNEIIPTAARTRPLVLSSDFRQNLGSASKIRERSLARSISMALDVESMRPHRGPLMSAELRHASPPEVGRHP
jgi:hypothetical protein